MIGYLINRLKLDKDTKEELIYMHSDGRTTHISELSKQEAIQVIKSLTSGANIPETPASKMRRKILSMAHELHWETRNGKVDLSRVNGWCVQYGGGKSLDAYTVTELPTLVSQFESMYLKHLKGI